MKTLTTLLSAICISMAALSQTTNINYSVIPIESAIDQGFFSRKTGTHASLNQNELAKIEYLVSAACNNYSQNERWLFRSSNYNNKVTPNYSISLGNYNQQLIPYIDKKGDKVVVVNCINKGAMVSRDWSSSVISQVHVITPPVNSTKSIITYIVNLKQNTSTAVNINYFTTPYFSPADSNAPNTYNYGGYNGNYFPISMR